MDRRKFIAGAASASLVSVSFAHALPSGSATALPKRYQNGQSPWPICLDTATIRPAKGLDRKVDIAIAAGYDAIEPWDSDLEEYEKEGGDLKQLGERIRKAGLFVPSMIGLWGCIPKNEEEFQKSLPATRNRMRMASE